MRNTVNASGAAPPIAPRTHFGAPADLVDRPGMAVSSTPGAHTARRGLRSFEWLALAVTIIGIGVVPWLPINPSKLAVDRVCQALSIAFVNVLTLRAVVPAMRWWRGRNSGANIVRELRTAYEARYIAYVVRAALAIQVTLLWFCCLKYVIPYLHPTVTDSALWRWDTIAHFGVNPSGFAVHLTQDWPALLYWTDWFYVGYFPILLLFFAFVLIQERRVELRDPFVFAYCIFWVLGGLSYFLLPSMGPIYYEPALFEGVMKHMPLASQLNKELLADYNAFVAAPWTHVPKLYYGIAAMPSLHVGACAMFACFARHFGRVPFGVMLTVTVLMFLGSVITGWHYAIDGYAGALLGWCAYRVAMRRGMLQRAREPLASEMTA